MELSASIELYAYWNAIRAGRASPERNAINPGAIRGILADTFVLDFDNRNGFPFRIAGSRANTLFLTELRGLSFLQLWREADRQEIKSILHRVASETQPFCLRAEAHPPGLGRLDIEATLMPLRHHGSTHSRVLGSLAACSMPHWLGLVGAGPMTLTSPRALASLAEPKTKRPFVGVALTRFETHRRRSGGSPGL
jgi:hypothetical protein